MALNSEQIQAVLRSSVLPTVADNIFTHSPLLMKVMGKAERWDTGRTLSRSVEVFEQDNVTAFSGADTLPTNLADTERLAEFDFRQVQAPAVIIGGERDAYATASSNIKATESLMGLAMERAKQNLLNTVGTQIYGDGTGTSNKEFLGTLAAADDGSSVVTYGGLSRTAITSWQGNRFAPGAGLTDLDDIAQAMSAATHGNRMPDVIMTTKALYDDLEAVYNPSLNQNYTLREIMITPNGFMNREDAMSGLMGHAGFPGLAFRGAQVAADENCTANYMYGINTNTFKFYGLDSAEEGAVTVTSAMEDIDTPFEKRALANIGLSFLPFQRPEEQYTEVGRFLMQGNFVTFSPRDHFVIIFS